MTEIQNVETLTSTRTTVTHELAEAIHAAWPIAGATQVLEATLMGIEFGDLRTTCVEFDDVRRAPKLLAQITDAAKRAESDIEVVIALLGTLAALAQSPVFRKRLPVMDKDGWEARGGNSGMAFAWFTWIRGHTGPTTIGQNFLGEARE